MNILELYKKFHRYRKSEIGSAPNTLRDFKSKIQTFMKRTGAIEISDIDMGMVQEFFYLGREEYDWSFSTYVNYHKYLKGFFGWCVEQGHMKINFVLDIKRPKEPQIIPRRLSEEQVQKILYTTFSMPYKYNFEQIRN